MQTLCWVSALLIVASVNLFSSRPIEPGQDLTSAQHHKLIKPMVILLNFPKCQFLAAVSDFLRQRTLLCPRDFDPIFDRLVLVFIAL